MLRRRVHALVLFLLACEGSPAVERDAGSVTTGGSAGSFAGAPSEGGISGVGMGGAAGSTSGVGGSRGGVAGSASGTGGSGTAGSSLGGTGGESNGGSPPGGFGGAPGEGGSLPGGGAGSSGQAGSGGGSGGSRPARVLLYSFSTLDIPSVPAQLAIFEQELESWNYAVEQSEDPAAFTDTNLARYAAVGMINTCFYPFGANNTTGEPQAQVLQRFLQQGGGLFGTHCADVTFQSASQPVLYNRLIGGRASSENFEGRSDCRKTGDHPTVQALPDTFAYTGNLDNTNFIASDSLVLVKCRWGNAAATDVAVSWVRNEGAGRVFFTNFGKVDSDLTNAALGESHIVSGLAWVVGRPLPL